MNIENWPTDRPKPYPRNARKLSRHAVDKVAASLREFGWRQPIVVDSKDVIICGHTRLLAAKEMGLDAVDFGIDTPRENSFVGGRRRCGRNTAISETGALESLRSMPIDDNPTLRPPIGNSSQARRRIAASTLSRLIGRTSFQRRCGNGDGLAPSGMIVTEMCEVPDGIVVPELGVSFDGFRPDARVSISEREISVVAAVCQ